MSNLQRAPLDRAGRAVVIAVTVIAALGFLTAITFWVTYSPDAVGTPVTITGAVAMTLAWLALTSLTVIDTVRATAGRRGRE